jgi:hypothetical protein
MCKVISHAQSDQQDAVDSSKLFWKKRIAVTLETKLFTKKINEITLGDITIDPQYIQMHNIVRHVYCFFLGMKTSD